MTGRTPPGPAGAPSRARPPRRPLRIRALTADVWFTLLYLRPRDQRWLEAGRAAVWARPLVSAGLRSWAANDWVARMQRWASRAESLGRAPTIEAQAGWLARQAGEPVDANAVGEELDTLVLAARVRVADGVTDALGKLRDEGLSLGIVSNVLHETARGARRLLDAAELAPYFRTIILSSEHPWSKPRPEPFRAALRELGVRADAAVHVGDLAYDVRGARRAGMAPILFTGLHRWEPSHLRALASDVDPSVPRLRRWADASRVVRELAGLPRAAVRRSSRERAPEP